MYIKYMYMFSYKTHNKKPFNYSDVREFNKIRHSSFKLLHSCIFGLDAHRSQNHH